MEDNMDNLKDLKRFVDFMNEYDLEQLEIEKEGKRIKLKKHPKIGSTFGAVQPAASFTGVSPEGGPIGGKTGVVPDEKLLEIKSPMVGTFYRAPAPDAAPYVEKGQKIKKGDAVCIIEAMKLMNEIKSEVDGTVEDILIENGEPVEFGQPLFRIMPA